MFADRMIGRPRRLMLILSVAALGGCHAPKPTWNNTFGGSATRVAPPGTGSYTAGKNAYYSGSSATAPLSSFLSPPSGEDLAVVPAVAESDWRSSVPTSAAPTDSSLAAQANFVQDAAGQEPVGSSVQRGGSLQLRGMTPTEIPVGPEPPRQMPLQSPGLLPLPPLPPSSSGLPEPTPPTTSGSGQWRQRY